jgi:hypothetical protein
MLRNPKRAKLTPARCHGPPPGSNAATEIGEQLVPGQTYAALYAERSVGWSSEPESVYTTIAVAIGVYINFVAIGPGERWARWSETRERSAVLPRGLLSLWTSGRQGPRFARAAVSIASVSATS